VRGKLTKDGIEINYCTLRNYTLKLYGLCKFWTIPFIVFNCPQNFLSRINIFRVTLET